MASRKAELESRQYFIKGDIRRLIIEAKYMENFEIESENDAEILDDYVKVFRQVTDLLKICLMEVSVRNEELNRIYRKGRNKKYGVVEETASVECEPPCRQETLSWREPNIMSKDVLDV